MNVISNRIKVTVAGNVFEIPSEKQAELLSILANWQSIAVTEQQNNTQQNPKYNGRQLIQE